MMYGIKVGSPCLLLLYCLHCSLWFPRDGMTGRYVGCHRGGNPGMTMTTTTTTVMILTTTMMIRVMAHGIDCDLWKINRDLHMDGVRWDNNVGKLDKECKPVACPSHSTAELLFFLSDFECGKQIGVLIQSIYSICFTIGNIQCRGRAVVRCMLMHL